MSPREQIELVLYRKLGENWKKSGSELTVTVEHILQMMDIYANGEWYKMQALKEKVEK